MTGRPWGLGQEYDGNNLSDFFEGNMDDVRFYNKELSVSEIQTL